MLRRHNSPTARGFAMPPEWAPHAATWLVWPKKPDTWPGLLDRIPPIYAQMVRALAEGEEVHVLVDDAPMETAARAVLREHRADAPSVVFHHIPTNDSWIRDAGPTFLKSRNGLQTLLLDWEYNSWGGKYPPFDLDNQIPRRLADLLGLPAVSPGVVLEGGSIDVNGAGVVLTTEQCLLNPNRNPHLSREQIEQILCDHLGVEKVLWLGDGIVGDDTDGHVDDLTRFVGERRVVTVVESDERDENFCPLRENRERLESMTDAQGRHLEIIDLPMPLPVIHEGQRTPASYANFYVGNAAVLVPTFDSGRRDEEAIATLRDCFPDRKAVDIRAVDLVWGLGAFHCLTQQQPR
jgi:agmatine deiminase